jgi:hypothetical protein
MLLLPAVASVALLAGCTGTPTPEETPTPTTNGVEALEADAILEEAQDAAASADSVRVEGTVTEADTTFTLDLVYAGADMQGTVDVFGVEADVIKIGSDVYVMADTTLFEQFLSPEQQALLPLMEGKWVKVDQGLAVIFIPGVPLTVEDLFTFTEPLEKGEVSEVDGTQVITVTDADGAEAQVAIEGEPYLLAISVEDEGFTFEYGEDVTVEAPPAADVLDVMALLGSG